MKQAMLKFMILGVVLMMGVDSQAASSLGVSPTSNPKSIPEFSLPNLEGKTRSISEWKGKVVLINFWASWCAPCIEEMPGLIELHNRYKDRGFEVVAVSVDRSKSDVEETQAKFKFPFEVLWDKKSKASGKFGVRTLPVSIMVQKDGTQYAVVRGPRPWNSKAAYEFIESMLSKP